MSDLGLYEEQLKQIQIALKSCENEEERKNLQSLQSDLKELINLSFLQSISDTDCDKSLDEFEKVF